MNRLDTLVSTAGVLEFLARNQHLRGCSVHGVDLRDVNVAWDAVDVAGALFLGCSLTPMQWLALSTHGALVIPSLPHLPFDPFRAALYTVDELMEGFDPAVPESFFHTTRDAKIYAHYRASVGARAQGRDLLGALAERMHDHAIETATLGELVSVRGTPVVGIMGGHSLARSSGAFRLIAEIGHRLAARGAFVTTGGGPGGMEAAHLGAWFSHRPTSELERAIHELSAAETYRDRGWFECAQRVRAWTSCGASSLGVPTWFYGHEPTNLFASSVAKFFSNSLREDGLVTIARGGIVFAPGAAGTVQEIFMDLCQNHYNTVGVVSPMVFVGTQYWTEKLPVWQLVSSLANDKPYRALLLLTDDPEQAVQFLFEHAPQEAL